MNATEIIEVIDGYLAELGTTGLVDARKARDQLMDLRLMFMSEVELPEVPDTIEGIEESVPVFERNPEASSSN